MFTFHFKKYTPFILPLLLIISALCHFYKSDITWFQSHMSRDFTRAMEWAHLTPSSWMGPEMNRGAGRLFGPAFYWMIALASLPLKTIESSILLLHLFSFAVLAFFCHTISRDLGRSAGILFAALFLIMPVHVMVSRTLWNPSLIIPINCSFILLARSACLHRSTRSLYLVLLLSIVAIQIHLSSAVGFFVVLLLLLLYKIPKRQVAALFLAFTGYLVFMWQFATSHHFNSSVQHSYSLVFPSLQMLRNAWFFFLYHVFLTPTPLGDYELFPLFSRITADKFLLLNSIFTLGFYLRPFYLLVFFSSLLLLSWRLFKKEGSLHQTFYKTLILLWGVIIVPILLNFTFQNRLLPYRYGLCLYPLQFLAIALAFSFFTNRFLRIFIGTIGGLTFLFYVVFNLGEIEVFDRVARISHLQTDNLELPLKYKRQLLQEAALNAPIETLFQYLHGPIARKIEYEEFSSETFVFLGGLMKNLKLPPNIPFYPREHYEIVQVEGTPAVQLKKIPTNHLVFDVTQKTSDKKLFYQFKVHDPHNMTLLLSYPSFSTRKLLHFRSLRVNGVTIHPQIFHGDFDRQEFLTYQFAEQISGAASIEVEFDTPIKEAFPFPIDAYLTDAVHFGVGNQRYFP